MNHNFETEDDLRPEYDFTQMTVVARGHGRKRVNVTINLDPDVAKFFPDSNAVNEGLRLINATYQTKFITIKRASIEYTRKFPSLAKKITNKRNYFPKNSRRRTLDRVKKPSHQRVQTLPILAI